MRFNAETIVKLLQVKGIGKGRVFALNEKLASEFIDEDFLAEYLSQNSTSLKIPAMTKSEVKASFAKGAEIIEYSYENNIKLIGFGDSDYPIALKNISSPPIILNALGNYKALNELPCAAVIGTRQPSDYGRQIGERIGFRLGESGINVVSGLALGCDSAGHIGCLRAHGITTAVLAHGLDTIYPKENRGLAQAILDNNGCLLSEYFVKTRGLPVFFVERDRIQAGLSKCTIVVETDIKGGTMHTVRNTLEYNRILAAFYHPADRRNDKSRGNEMLIQNGEATRIQTQDDITTLINKINPINLEQRSKPEFQQLIDGIQMPFFDMEALIVQDYTAGKKKKATKAKKKDSNLIKEGEQKQEKEKKQKPKKK